MPFFFQRYEPNQISIVDNLRPEFQPYYLFILPFIFHSMMDQAQSRYVNALNFKYAPIKINKRTFSVLFSVGGGKKNKSGNAPSISLKEQR